MYTMSKEKRIVDACTFKTQSCLNFGKVNNLLIKMINNHYFDLQMYANFVFDIDNEKEDLSEKNNFYVRIKNVQSKYKSEYPEMPLFTEKKMEQLEENVKQILATIGNRISAHDYLSNMEGIEFFGSGAASSTILLKAYRKVDENSVTPLIIKLIPFQLPHHYHYLPTKDKKNFIFRYIESPGYALFIKEAWMYCFSKNELSKYTPTFTCVSNCYIINGLPVGSLEYLRKIYDIYAKKRISAGKTLPYKKWFNILLDPTSDATTKQQIMESDYGCFEMKQIDGTLDDILNKPASFSLSLIFEYLYTKIVSAFIGRIIFTDDHFGNVAFINVTYTRLYKIKCNGCLYSFYMPPGKMVQFIDLERYIFNYSPYDIYTNTALKNLSKSDFPNITANMNRIKTSYTKNNYIFDKSLVALHDESFTENNFEDKSEYQTMLNILSSHFTHDIKTFCQIMETNLPQKYLTKPTDGVIFEYFLNLDDNGIRVINFEKINALDETTNI